MTKLMMGSEAKALYIQIKDIYRNRILSGELHCGDKIESELEIQNKYEVSRITARQAILDLEKEGMVKRGRGKGTFVIYKPGIEIDVSRLAGFTAVMEDMGRIPSTSNLRVRVEPLGHAVAMCFQAQAQENEEMICIRRVRRADDIRLAYAITYIPTAMDMPKNEEAYEGSLYELYDAYGMRPVCMDQKIRTVLPNEEVIRELNIEKNQPVFVRQIKTYDGQGRIIEYSTVFYRGDMITMTNQVDK